MLRFELVFFFLSLFAQNCAQRKLQRLFFVPVGNAESITNSKQIFLLNDISFLRWSNLLHLMQVLASILFRSDNVFSLDLRIECFTQAVKRKKQKNA